MNETAPPHELSENNMFQNYLLFKLEHLQKVKFLYVNNKVLG